MAGISRFALTTAAISMLTAILLFSSCTSDKKSPTDSGSGTPPPAPGALTATAKSDTQIELSWKDNSTDEKLFRIECREADGKYTEIATVPPNTMMYRATELKMDVEYTFRVRAHNEQGNSEYSNAVTVRTKHLPNAPSALTATMVSSSSLELSWEDNSDDEQGFRIERREGAGQYAVAGTASPNVKSYSITGLLADKEYAFRVCAYLETVNSPYSNEVVVNTITVPSAPTGLTVTATSTFSVDLAWKDNSGNEQGFRIERREGNGTYTVAGTVSPNVESFSVTGLQPEKEYTFRICASGAAVNSQYSNEAVSTTKSFPAPGDLSAVAASSSQINLTWKDTSQGEQGFRIERKQPNGTWAEIGTVSANGTGYAATGLSGNTVYTFRVRAFNGSCYSAYSEEMTARTSIVIQSIMFAPIPAGSFSMGSSFGESNETPVHAVTLSGFEMSVCEITQSQYKAITGSNPSNFTGDSNLPVEQVTWMDAVKFCNALSAKAGLQPCYNESSWGCDFSKSGFRLPTEAEWEYACRAGSTTRYNLGDTESDLARAGWYDANSGSKTHPSGGKTPNAWGLYDMHGNVFEWCNDWYGSYTAGSVTDPTGPPSGSFRVVRGGSWGYDGSYCRSSDRYSSYPGNWGYITGFRVVRRTGGE